MEQAFRGFEKVTPQPDKEFPDDVKNKGNLLNLKYCRLTYSLNPMTL